MEEYVDILQNILAQTKVDASPNYLDDYFKIIDANGRLEILKNNDTWNQAFSEIEDSYKIRKYEVTHNPDMVADFSKIISAIVAVKKPNKKIDLFSLITYLDQSNFFFQHLIDNDFFKGIEGNIFSILSSIDIEINMPDISDRHWELESYNNYKKGLRNKDIRQIYNFISAYERGNGLLPNSYINFMVFVLYSTSYNQLIKILEQQEDVLTIKTLVDSLPASKKLKIAVEVNSPILKFEVLREIFYFGNTTFDPKGNALVKEIIIDISKDTSFWKQFLMFYLEFPSRSPQLFETLGLALNQLNNKNIEPFIESIKIDKYLSNECKSALNLCFFNIENESIQQFISKKVFERWLEFIESYDEYTDSILITNVIDIVIHYTNNFIEDSQVIEDIDLIIEDIQELDNEWFVDEMMQTTVFYKAMSKLFIYGISANTKMIDRQRLIQDIFDTNLILKHENCHNKKTTKALFSELMLTPESVLTSREKQREVGNQKPLDWEKAKDQIRQQIDNIPPTEPVKQDNNQ